MNTLRDAKPEPGDVVIIGKARVRCTVVKVGALDVTAVMPKGGRIAIPLDAIAFDLERASQRQRPEHAVSGPTK
jgi:hypothetical protein